ncbi:MAG: AAA family ATPase [Erysipelotrichaceae bacterium]|nr:AAA family ATPase [Erysipelotrichaceae bacterium]
MKIKSIEFENFRNFRDPGKIQFATDGTVTIVYGKNGDGKTTLHQLFQWIIYGKVKFNKTATEHMYNLSFQKAQPFGTVFKVSGTINFEQDNHEYAISRVQTYKKGVVDSTFVAEEVTLQMMDEDYNWKDLDRPAETMEKLLPSGLSEYFFFDGESMIADLRVKGKESAKQLRKALYSMFDLDVIESALSHIGKNELKSTALGKLYLSKAPISSGGEIATCKANIENAQNKLEQLNNTIKEAKNKKEELTALVNELSEKIGGTPSSEEYERRRKEQKDLQEVFFKNEKIAKSSFGELVSDEYAPLLISKTVLDAQKKLNLRVNSKKLPTGLNKSLVDYLSSGLVTECICGEPLCQKQIDHLKDYLRWLPPKSYASMYQEFTTNAQRQKDHYDKTKLEDLISNVIDNADLAKKCDEKIKQLDEEKKNSRDVEELIVSRVEAEEEIKNQEKIIADQTELKNKFDLYLKQQMRKFDELTSASIENKAIDRKMEILGKVRDIFETRLENASNRYSKDLQENIQNLLNEMLTSKRKVSVSNEFAVRVTDSFNDESKSEGQFAVVSFAYIGGILQLLKQGNNFYQKEYPLVLDGPFSKLDKDQRQNVVNLLPKFAPQVIIFSKDDLSDVFESKNVGRTWTILSNDEKNVARVEEGMLWK